MGTAQDSTAGKRDPATFTKGGKSMTRAECEEKIKVKLNEIRKILCEYSIRDGIASISVSPDYVSAYRIICEQIDGKPIFDIDFHEFYEKDVI